MNQIRKNEEEEYDILRAECEMPETLKILLIVAEIICCVFIVCGIVMLAIDGDDYLVGVMVLVFGYIGGIILLGTHIFYAHYIKCTTLTITNLRIKGTTSLINGPWGKYYYSHRLDMIDDVQYANTFGGIKSLRITFTQGVDMENSGANNKPNTLSIMFLKDGESVYQKISQLIGNIKNDKEVKADIATQQIDAQLMQARAFATLAEHVTKKVETIGVNKTDEVNQLKQLKELYDDGIISKEDFQEMIRKIIDK